MGDKGIKCFVCQSKPQSAGGCYSGTRRRTTNNTYNNLDPSGWKIFCHYFYPPPLVGLLDSSSPAPGNEEFSRHAFCGVCWQNIFKLCNLHSQLEIIQNQISKVVAQVSRAFIQEEENHGNDNYDPLSLVPQKRRGRPKKLGDEEVSTVRSCIRERYQPPVNTATKTNIPIPSSSSKNNPEVGEPSPLPMPFNPNLYPDLNFSVNPSPVIKQEEDEDLSNEPMDNEELDNLKVEAESDERMSSGEEDGNSSGDEHDIDLDHDPDYDENEDGEHDSPGKLVADKPKDPLPKTSPYRVKRLSAAEIKQAAKRRISWTTPRKRGPGKDKDPMVGDNIFEYDGKWRYEKKVDEQGNTSYHCSFCPKNYPKRFMLLRHMLPVHNKDLLKSKDPKVGENIYEYEGKWRYEKKFDESGTVKFYCLHCSQICNKRFHVLDHFKLRHNGIMPKVNERQRIKRIDDNNFTYDGIYSITRVTEPNGTFYKCGECGTLRKTLVSAIAHLQEIHIDPQKCVCEICGYSCPTKARLKFHMESRHEETRKWVCEECGKAFKTQDRMKIHQQCHIAEGFKCECGRSFVYRHTLKRHRVRVNHPAPPKDGPEAPFVPQACKFCKREFVKEENLIKHLAVCRDKAKEKKQCSWCSRFFRCVGIHKKHHCKLRHLYNPQVPTDNVNINTEEVPPGAEEESEEESESEGNEVGEVNP